jgi:thioredoxin reductase (NADPH)
VVDIQTMQTSIPGIFAAGDIATYSAKFKLIATGAAEAVTAVNHALVHINPDARLDGGHSTTIMEKRQRAEEVGSVINNIR